MSKISPVNFKPSFNHYRSFRTKTQCSVCVDFMKEAFPRLQKARENSRECSKLFSFKLHIQAAFVFIAALCTE